MLTPAIKLIVPIGLMLLCNTVTPLTANALLLSDSYSGQDLFGCASTFVVVIDVTILKKALSIYLRYLWHLYRPRRWQHFCPIMKQEVLKIVRSPSLHFRINKLSIHMYHDIHYSSPTILWFSTILPERYKATTLRLSSNTGEPDDPGKIDVRYCKNFSSTYSRKLFWMEICFGIPPLCLIIFTLLLRAEAIDMKVLSVKSTNLGYFLTAMKGIQK